MGDAALDQRMLQAAYDGDDVLVEALLKKGADPRARDSRGLDAGSLAWMGYSGRIGTHVFSGRHPEPELIEALIQRAGAESEDQRRQYDEDVRTYRRAVRATRRSRRPRPPAP